jgi:hypothetical protein
MRELNQTVTFTDYAGVIKEGVIIEIVGEKFKIKTANGIKWVVGEERIISPKQPELTKQEETQKQPELTKQPETQKQPVLTKQPVGCSVPPKHSLTAAQQQIWEDAKGKGLSKKELVLYLKERGITKKQQEKLGFASEGYIYEIFKGVV